MSDSENSDDFMKEEYIPIGKKKKVKEKKVRKEMTPERKAKLLEQLKKGRETAMNNRTKTAQYNKILKDKEKKRVDDVLEEDYKKRNNKKDMEKENEELRNKLKLFEEQKHKEPLKTIKEEPQIEVKEKQLKPVEKIIQIAQHIQQAPQIINSGRIKNGSFWKSH